MNSDLVTKPIPRRVPPRERFTYAEFCSRVQEQKADLINGEVISPGSRRLDFVDKRELYANFGVLEYWLIDLYKQQAFFWKNVNGIWEDLPVDENGIVRSEVLTGFWLRVDWLFAAEELEEMEILETVLAGDPRAK